MQIAGLLLADGCFPRELVAARRFVIVAHGRANAHAIRHAIRVAKQAIEQDVLGKIQAGIQQSAAEVTL